MGLMYQTPPYTKVTLSQGKVALVDTVDLPLIAGHTWHAAVKNGMWYAFTNVYTPRGRRPLRMHILLMGAPGIDHIDCDGLNNRRVNLRFATPKENSCNRRKTKSPALSPYKGVTWNIGRKRWLARVMKDQKSQFLGYFEDDVEAAKAYDAAARVAHGKYARLNFPMAT